MFAKTGEYYEHAYNGIAKSKYYTFTPKPLTDGEYYSMDEELSALLVEAHEKLGILKGMLPYISNHNFLAELFLLEESNYSRNLDYIDADFYTVLKNRDSDKSSKIHNINRQYHSFSISRELFKLFKYTLHHEISIEQRDRKNAVGAIYEQMQEKRKKPDTLDLMITLQSIINEYVIVENPTEGLVQSKLFDISKIDFDRLRQEFGKVKTKNLFLKDLQDLVEDRLASMLKRNPKRINYNDKYQQIIEEYNAEQNKAAIEKTFIDLINLVNDLDEEEKRYVREGFSSDEELAMYDLLMKDALTPAEIKKVKLLAAELLEKIKAKIHELDHWTDKEETQAVIELLIRDTLCELPESYDCDALLTYRKRIYEFIYSTYPAA